MKNNDDRNNHSNQMNPNNEAYWQARGYNERPDDWEDLLANNQEDRQVQERRHGAPKAEKVRVSTDVRAVRLRPGVPLGHNYGR